MRSGPKASRRGGGGGRPVPELAGKLPNGRLRDVNNKQKPGMNQRAGTLNRASSKDALLLAA